MSHVRPRNWQTPSAQATDINGAPAHLAAHAIAVLVRCAAFRIADSTRTWWLHGCLPPAPACLPHCCNAGRILPPRNARVAAANAEIGVVRAAFYPNISLNLIFGFQDTGFNMFNPARTASGRWVRASRFLCSKAVWRTAEEDAAAAVYRRTVAGLSRDRSGRVSRCGGSARPRCTWLRDRTRAGRGGA